MRNSRALQSGAIKFTALPAATTATAAQVLPANDAATARAILNTSTGVMKLWLCDLATKQGGQGESYQIPAKQTWEDMANYTGPIVVEFAVADGPANCSEWV